MKTFKYFFIIGSVIGILSSCDKTRVYEENMDLPNKQWFIDSIAVFDIDLKENKDPLNICFTVRNTIDYPFCNLYVRYYLEDSLGKQIASRQTEMTLMDPKTGKPFGKGISDIYEHVFFAEHDFKFPYKGKYRIRLKQYMRENPLKELVSIGVRLENPSKEK
jgi:gliding motility-associated lipoprotein GldH